MRNRVESSLVITDELLMAYADGELEDPLAQQIGHAIDGDPALVARLEVFRATGRALAPHFDAVQHAQPPVAMLQVIRSAPMTLAAQAPRKISFGQSVRNVLQSIGLGPSPWTALAGLAAGLLIGLVSAQWAGPTGAFIDERNGQLFAAGALENMLETATMSESRESSTFVLSTFKGGDGRWCRIYQGPDHAGLACRQNEQPKWQILAAGQGVAGADDMTTPSEGGGAKAVDDLAMTMMESSAALDTKTEAALIGRQWRSE